MHGAGKPPSHNNRTPASAAWRRPSTQLAQRQNGVGGRRCGLAERGVWGQFGRGQFGVLERYMPSLERVAVLPMRKQLREPEKQDL